MSRGYFERKRKQHITIFIIAAAVILLAVCGALVLRSLQNSGDADFGKIEDVENDQSEVLETEPQEKDTTPIKALIMDVGDAEAVLVDYGSTEILYDCGYAENGKKVADTIEKYVNGPLEYLILSHSHADHVGGAPSVLERYTVKTIITSGEKEGSSKEFDAAMKAVKEEGCEVVEDADLTFDIGEDATLNIVETYDPGQLEGDEDNPNEYSVVAYISRGNDSVLITGDSEAGAERMLKGKFHSVTLYVAGHHLSSSSSNALLLAEWSPEIVVASCAGPKKSEYGFPHQEAIDRCRIVTSEVYATYKSGDILVTLDEKDGASINCNEDDRL